METRSAKIATGIRRRVRASRRSCPSLRRARVTGTGIRDDCPLAIIMSTIIYLIRYNVQYYVPYDSSATENWGLLIPLEELLKELECGFEGSDRQGVLAGRPVDAQTVGRPRPFVRRFRHFEE